MLTAYIDVGRVDVKPLLSIDNTVRFFNCLLTHAIPNPENRSLYEILTWS